MRLRTFDLYINFCEIREQGIFQGQKVDYGFYDVKSILPLH